jgi:hypothetical protein
MKANFANANGLKLNGRYLPVIDPRKTCNLADLIFSLVDRLLRTQLALAQIDQSKVSLQRTRTRIK